MQVVSQQTSNAPFSYQEYREVLKKVRPPLKTFKQTLGLDAFTILRHDVEFSITRAHTMAQIEYGQQVSSTFFFQVCSSAYNPFSVQNAALIQDIKAMGHHIGLHFYVSLVPEGADDLMKTELQRQKKMFEAGLGVSCTCFSFHRPPPWVLEIRKDKIGGLLNAYGPSFFEFSKDPIKIKYIADSKHQWSYGHPLDTYSHRKLQILIHPDEWTEHGYDAKDNFGSLIEEHRDGFFDTLDSETNIFKDYREELK